MVRTLRNQAYTLYQKLDVDWLLGLIRVEIIIEVVILRVLDCVKVLLHRLTLGVRVVRHQTDDGGGDFLHAAVKGYHGLSLLVALVQVLAGVQIIVDDVTVLETGLIGAGHRLFTGQGGRTRHLRQAQGCGEHFLSSIRIGKVDYR